MKKTFIASGIVILLLGLCSFYYIHFIMPNKQANQDVKGSISSLESDDGTDVEAMEEKQVLKNEERSQDKKDGVVYVVPGMDEIKVTKDIVYKVDNDTVLNFDVYHPLGKDSSSKSYPVILIHGQTPDINFKDTKYFTSWGELVAASGYTAIAFNWRSGIEPSDISDLIVYVQEHTDELGITTDRMSIIAFSMGVEDGVREALTVNTGFIDSIVAYYGKMPVKILEDSSELNLPPMFIAKAAHDQYFPVDCNDEFIEKARDLGCEVIEIVHSEGVHGFDVLNDDEQSYEIIRQSLEFIELKSK